MRSPASFLVLFLLFAFPVAGLSQEEVPSENNPQFDFVRAHSKVLEHYQAGDYQAALAELRIVEGILQKETAIDQVRKPEKPTDEAFERLLRKAKSPLSIPVSGVVFKVDHGDPVFYMSSKGALKEYLVSYHNPRKFKMYFSINGKPITMNQYFKARDGKTLEVKLASSNPDIVSIGKEAGEIVFVGQGDCLIDISVGMVSAQIPLRVVVVPLGGQQATAEGIISGLGLPDKETSVNVFWPDSERLDGVFYGYSDDTNMRKITHWQYTEFPGAVLSFEGKVKNLQGVRNSSWEKLFLHFL